MFRPRGLFEEAICRKLICTADAKKGNDMKNTHVFALVALVIIILGSLLTYVVVFKPTGTTQINNYQNKINNASGSLSGTTNCSTTATQSVQVHLQFINQTATPAQPNALPGETVNLYQTNPYGQSVFQSGTSTTSSVAITGVNCNTRYLVGAGDTGTAAKFFTNFTNVTVGVSSNPSITLTLLNYSVPTVQVQNASTSAFASITQYHKAQAGVPIGNIGITVKSGKGSDSQGPGVLMLIYSTSSLSTPTIPGAQLANQGLLPTPTFVNSNTVAGSYFQLIDSQNAYVGYYLSACSNGAYSTPSGCVSGQAAGTITPSFSPKSTYANNAIVSIEWIPATGYYNLANSYLGAPGPKYGVFYAPTSTNQALITNTIGVNAIQIEPQ